MSLYKGKEGQWSWFLHRVTGVGVLLFLFAHILDTMLVGWGPDVYNKVISVYAHPVFRTMEVGLFAAVLYHALNGLRIVLIDFWPGAVRHHKQIFYVTMTLFVAIMIPSAYMMLRHIWA
jgi:succinate dehydrogenase / fumarate reductase, cytochrome b subunit